VEQMKASKTRDDLAYRRQCAAVPLAYASFKRWKARQERGEAIVRKAGPKKVRPMDLHELYGKIQRLSHRRRRTHGTGGLYRTCRHGISRRDYQGLIAQARREANDQMQEIQWLVPGLVWSLDDFQYGSRREGTLWFHSSQDLGSRYKFSPVAGEHLIEGPVVAVRLEKRFRLYGPPLFLKRDNGGNLNHEAVNRLLEKYFVLPLNSPGYYAQYNGGIEHAQGEIQTALRQRILPPCTVPQAQSAAEAAVHELNHNPRRILKGRTSCDSFHHGRGNIRCYNTRRRREVLDSILSKAADILAAQEAERKLTPGAAWRIAAKIWLQQNGAITLAARGRVLPSFPEKGAHN
jgi:hypothetical protein